MSVISFSGLATGIDTGSLVTALVRAERGPINRLEAESKTLTARSDKYKSLRTKVEALEKAAKALASRNDVLSVKASSSEPGILSASASGGASLGRYDVQVTSLATAGRAQSDSRSARNVAGLVSAGTLDITVGGGAAVSIDVTASDTLDSIAAKINQSGARVTAGVTYDGSQYRLRVEGTDTGVANALSLTERDGLDLGLGRAENQLVTAGDAALTIDGQAITSPTNTVIDAIPGVTLALSDTSPPGSTQRVEITRDGGALIDKAKAFVEAYNSVAAFVQTESSFSGVTKGPESLMGDSALRSVQGRLRGALQTNVAGASGRYTTLASLGMSSRNDGSLVLDEAKLTTAITAEPEAVASFLGGTGGIMASIGNEAAGMVHSRDGLLSQRMSSIDGRKRDIADQIDRLEVRLTKYEDNLRRQFTSLETLVSRLQGQGQQMLAVLGGLS